MNSPEDCEIVEARTGAETAVMDEHIYVLRPGDPEFEEFVVPFARLWHAIEREVLSYVCTLWNCHEQHWHHLMFRWDPPDSEGPLVWPPAFSAWRPHALEVGRGFGCFADFCGWFVASEEWTIAECLPGELVATLTPSLRLSLRRLYAQTLLDMGNALYGVPEDRRDA